MSDPYVNPLSPIDYVFPVADGQVIAALRLPMRLSQTDADRLKDFIDSLVIAPGPSSVAPDSREPAA